MIDMIAMLPREEIERALQQIDPVDVVERILAEKQAGRTTLPSESTLYWQTGAGKTARSIGMPGALPAWGAYGMKIINSSLANQQRGLPRASGLMLMFDPETAQIVAVFEAARLSAYRTAVVSLVGASRLVASGPVALGLIGAGPIGLTHLEVFLRHMPVERLVIHDQSCERGLAAAEHALAQGFGGSIDFVTSTEALMAAANCVITATTTVAPYIDARLLRSGQTIVNVSLDDLDDSAFLAADQIWADDLQLVIDDPRRRLGCLLRDGRIPAIAGELGQLVTGDRPGRSHDGQIIIFNPFGMAIVDVGLASALLDARLKAAA